MMTKSQPSRVELALNWSLKGVRVGTATMQQEVSSASPPPLCSAPNLVVVGWRLGEGLKEKQDVEGLLGSAALPHVPTGGRQSACWPPAGPEDKVRAETPPLQQQTLEQAFSGARLCDLYGSASSGWAAVVLLGGKGRKTRANQLWREVQDRKRRLDVHPEEST